LAVPSWKSTEKLVKQRASTWVRIDFASNLRVEAEMAKNRIIELKQQDLQKRREELLLQQAQEREEVENAHVEEYQTFNKQWDDVLNQLEQEQQNSILMLEDRHVKELEMNRQDLENKLPMTFKHSAELLNMKKIQINLAKQKE